MGRVHATLSGDHDRVRARGALDGANAIVVGLLLAALYRPVGVGVLTSLPAGLPAVGAFIALQFFRWPPWLIVTACAVAGGIFLRG